MLDATTRSIRETIFEDPDAETYYRTCVKDGHTDRVASVLFENINGFSKILFNDTINEVLGHIANSIQNESVLERAIFSDIERTIRQEEAGGGAAEEPNPPPNPPQPNPNPAPTPPSPEAEEQEVYVKIPGNDLKTMQNLPSLVDIRTIFLTNGKSYSVKKGVGDHKWKSKGVVNFNRAQSLLDDHRKVGEDNTISHIMVTQGWENRVEK